MPHRQTPELPPVASSALLAPLPPALVDAIHRGDDPEILRLARQRAGWSQTELAHRFGCHPSHISRFEHGHRALRDTDTLRRLAFLLDLPIAAFGLHDRATSPANPPNTPRVSTHRHSQEDDMRRRTMLAASGILGADLITRRIPATNSASTAAEHTADPLDPAVLLTDRLGQVLLGQAAPADPRPLPQLQRALTAARDTFDRADYLAMASQLPRLARTAEATAAHTPRGNALLAPVYGLITRVLIKLPASGLEWISADRACRAANATADPLIHAEAERLKASACRRAGHHQQAHDVLLAAADHLDTHGPAQHLALHAALMCTASYGAARAGNHDLAVDLLTNATNTAARLTEHRALHETLAANITSHQVSVLHLLGDPATALHHARTAGAIRFPNTERQGRFLVDIALAHHALDSPGAAYNALREAEHRAPGEVHTRHAARTLITELATQRRTNLPGIHDLATRAHVA